MSALIKQDVIRMRAHAVTQVTNGLAVRMVVLYLVTQAGSAG